MFTAGQRIVKYLLKMRLGNGHFGEVWLAQDEYKDQEVAVKIIPGEDWDDVVALLNESRIGGKLKHDNLVNIVSADVYVVGDDKFVFISMDYHENGSICSLANSKGFVRLDVAIKSVCNILCGLERLHYNGVLHNDIKPKNILVGSKGEAILTDYGISAYCAHGEKVSPPGAYVLHRAPECVASSSFDHCADVYQAGVTAFRLVNGLNVLDELLAKHGLQEFERLKGLGKIPDKGQYLPFVPLAVRKTINKAMNHDSSSRFQSALEFRRELEKVILRGYWTVDENGKYVGYLDGDEYSYELSTTRKGVEFVPRKTYVKSGRSVVLRSLCKLCGDKKSLYKAVSGFMQDVVLGKV